MNDNFNIGTPKCVIIEVSSSGNQSAASLIYFVDRGKTCLHQNCYGTNFQFQFFSAEKCRTGLWVVCIMLE